MEPRAPASNLLQMGAQRKPSGTTPAKAPKRGLDALEAPAPAAAVDAGPGASGAGTRVSAHRQGVPGQVSTGGALGLSMGVLNWAQPPPKRAKTEAAPRERARAPHIVVHQRGGAKAFKSPALLSQPPSQAAPAGDAAAAPVAPPQPPAADTAGAPRPAHADGALPQRTCVAPRAHRAPGRMARHPLCRR
jgi:hypothetical protein